MIDTDRSAVYEAEALVTAMVDRGAEVRFHGTRLLPEADRRFGQVGDIDRYLQWLRTHPWAYPQTPAPTVRVRRGAAKASWESPGTIAIPDAAWARRELVVLHEYAHHAVWHSDGSGDVRHSPRFCRTLADLVRNAVGPSTGLLLTDAFYQAGLMAGSER